MTYDGPVKPGTTWRCDDGTVVHLSHYDQRAKKWVYSIDGEDERGLVGDDVLRRRYAPVEVAA